MFHSDPLMVEACKYLQIDHCVSFSCLRSLQSLNMPTPATKRNTRKRKDDDKEAKKNAAKVPKLDETQVTLEESMDLIDVETNSTEAEANTTAPAEREGTTPAEREGTTPAEPEGTTPAEPEAATSLAALKELDYDSRVKKLSKFSRSLLAKKFPKTYQQFSALEELDAWEELCDEMGVRDALATQLASMRSGKRPEPTNSDKQEATNSGEQAATTDDGWNNDGDIEDDDALREQAVSNVLVMLDLHRC